MTNWKDQLKSVKKVLNDGKATPTAIDGQATVPSRSARASHVSLPPRVTVRAPPAPTAKSEPGLAARASRLDLPRPMKLVRQGEFRVGPPWTSKGSQTQLVTAPSGRAIQICIGLDFGTAYTKAAIGLFDKIFPVDWSGIRACEQGFLLPSEYTALSDGRAFLGQHPLAQPGDLVTGLKQDFIAGTIDDAAIRRAAVFVAMALQYIRSWVFEQHGLKLSGRPLRWSLNIGVPSDGFEDQVRRKAYQRLMRLAWSLSLSPPKFINFTSASQIPLSQEGALPRDLAESDAVPEFVAQLAGYSQSAQRQNGLHALVDIGGGTVDIVTFNVHHVDGDDVFPFFVPKVEPLGTFGLVANRLRRGLAVLDPGKRPLSELTDALEFAHVSGVLPAVVQDCDAHFLGEVSASFESVLRITRKRRYRLAPEWRSGVRTFVTGGGAHVTGYRDALKSGKPGDVNLVWLDLPPPSNLDGFDVEANDYQRVSVACGLARNALSLGLVRPASEVDDDLGPTSKMPVRERLSHEDMYPPR